MARKELKPSTVKKLFAFSGNQCTYPGCNNKLIEENILVGEICHIEAAEEGGKRYNINSDDEQRRDLSNLILMCPICHKKIDADEKKYSTDLLKEWKNTHENKYKEKNIQVSEDFVELAIKTAMKQENNTTGNGTQFNNQSEKINIGSQIGVQNIYQKDEKKEEIIDFGKGYRKVIKTFKDDIDFILKNSSDDEIEYYKDKRLGNKKYRIYHVPIKYLKLRKHNGRIKADVKTFERKSNREIDEIKEQELLKDFLINNDKVQTEKLKILITTETQREPAIITSDGFLINGNRRRAVFEMLYHENFQDKQFETMKVVVLDPKVALLDIERIENRFQLQDEGKSEYSGLNRALSIRDKIENGYSLETQLKDDPLHYHKKGRVFQNEVKKYKAEFLNPLEVAERYLRYFHKDGLYDLVTDAIGSKDGRWQALKDYSNFYYGTLLNDKQRRKAKIRKEDIGKIEDIAFKIIRKRELGGLGSLYSIIRRLKDYANNEDAQKHLYKITKEVDVRLPAEEMIDPITKQQITEKVEDKKWGKYFEKQILTNLHQADSVIGNARLQEKPMDLLKQALKKLEHENLDVKNINVLEDITDAIDILRKIQARSAGLEEELDHYRYQLKKGLKDHFNDYKS